MGGKRLRTGFIEDEKQRIGNYKRRTANLMKKAKELETLCDIQVCVIMSGPTLSGAGRDIPARIFPPELDKARLVLQNFKNATLNKTHRSLTLSEVLGKAKRQPKTAAKNPDNNHGSWYEDVRKLPLPQLEALYGSVTEKLKHVTSLCNSMVPSPPVTTLVDPTVHDFYYQTRFGTQDRRLPMITNDNDIDFSALSMTNSQFDQNPPRPHDHHHHPNLVDPYSNLMAMMMSDDDVSTQFMKESPIESMVSNNSNNSNNGYIPYDVPRYGNEVSNFIDFSSSFGVVNNMNYPINYSSNNSWVLSNPSTPMWCLSTKRADDQEESEISFGGFRF